MRLHVLLHMFLMRCVLAKNKLGYMIIIKGIGYMKCVELPVGLCILVRKEFFYIDFINTLLVSADM